jgi:NAD-reducing hydrogenase large subunit
MRRVIIDPVTRIEGHAKISIFVDEAGQVVDARFHVTEFRGFEAFCRGRPFPEMPGLTARVCGICPVSHLLCSAKAGDGILGVRPPPTAVVLRRLMNLAQLIQSHALSFFHLSSPDFLLGFDSDPASRNLFGMIRANPELARAGIRLRQFGQRIIEHLGGRKVHPSWAVPGGVRSGLTPEAAADIREQLPEAQATTLIGIDLIKSYMDRHPEDIAVFGQFPSLYLGLVRPEDHGWEHHDGVLRIVDSSGAVIADDINPVDYSRHIGEAVEADSYLKSPFYKPLGYPAGMYRVGPLARLNICTGIGTEAADRELREFRQRAGGIANSAFLYHYARLIEILAAIEFIPRHLDDPQLTADRLRAEAGVNQLDAVGCSEAPRGTLFHDYSVDPHGLITRVNLIIATGQNNLAMNRTIAQIARHYIREVRTSVAIPEGFLNRVEHGIRCYDPCLSCSTHALGQMPLVVRFLGPDGEVIAEVRR